MLINKDKTVEYKVQLSQSEYQMLMFCVIYTMQNIREKEENNVMRPKDIKFHPMEDDKEVLVNTDEIFDLQEILKNCYEHY